MGKPVGALEEEKKGERPSDAVCVCVWVGGCARVRARAHTCMCVCSHVCICAGPHDVHYYILLKPEQTPAE